MIRELFSIGPLSISPFGVMLVFAFLGAWALLRWGMRYQGIGDEEDASALLLAAGIGGIVGAKAYYAILYGDASLLVSRSGLVWYGGLIGGALAVVWTLHRRKLPIWPVVDVAAPAVALGHAVGRVGCFLVGDDFGMPTSMPWGVKFPHGLPAPTTAGFMRREYGATLPADVPANQLVAVHPTQLYETGLALVACAVGVWLVKRGARPGTAALVVLGLLAVERFVIEFWRAKDDRIFGDFTGAQVISVLLLLMVAGLWALRSRRAAAEAS